VSPKLSRLVLVASVAMGLALAPLQGALAASVVDVKDDQFLNTDNTNSVTVQIGDEITWRVAGDAARSHTVTPYDTNKWGKDSAGNGDDLTSGKEYTVKFTKADTYVYYCKNHGGGDKAHPTGMWGVVKVVDPNATTTTTATAPPTTTTTLAPTTTTTAPHVTPTTSAPAASQGARPPVTAAPAPTTTTAAKPDKDKKDKKDETTTTTETAPPPVDLPDSAIIPALPGSETGSLTQNGAETPGENPTGEAVALLKNKKKGGEAMKLLIISGIGLGALGFGTAGYKYANRSSKYFPA